MYIIISTVSNGKVVQDMKASEQLAFDILDKAFTSDRLWEYVFDIQDRYADDLDQLYIDNPEMADYL